MRPIPKKLREQLNAEEYYHRCARLAALDDHRCERNPMNGQLIEWEHAMYFASKQVNERWAIIPLCWWAHSGPGFSKKINIWLALNRATDQELLNHSLAEDLRHKREYLNHIFGTP